METAIDAIEERANNGIVEKKESVKIEVKDELRKELVTRELFEERLKSLSTEIKEGFNVVDERFKVVDEKFKSLHFKMNLFIAIALIALTFANPNFVALIGKIF